MHLINDNEVINDRQIICVLFEVIFFLWSCSKEIGFLTALFLITLRNLSTTSLMPTKLLEVKVVD